MTKRQEFTKFIKTLNKADLVKIVLELTRRKEDVQNKILLEYGKGTTDLDYVDINFIKDQLDKIDHKVFNKSWTRITSSVVGKYCRETNKVITNYIEPLIKREHYYDAFELLQEVFYYIVNVAIGYSLYKYESSDSFFNKLEKDFDKIFDNAKGYELFRISKLLYDNLNRDPSDLIFAFNMTYLAGNYFENEEWEQEKEHILINEIDKYLKNLDKTKPAPDTLSQCAYDLINLKISNDVPEEEVKELIKKYDYLGDIARLKAQNFINDGDYKEAKECLKEASALPTMSDFQKYQNSNMLIKLLHQEGDNIPELKEEVKHNLDTFTQDEPINLFIYFSLLDPSELEKAYKYYLDYPTTKKLYQNSLVKTFYIGVLALINRNYNKLDGYSSEFILILHSYLPDKTNQFIITRSKDLMKDGATEKNYKETEKLLHLLYNLPNNREVYNNLKQELLQTYPGRAKLKDVFKRIEDEKPFYYN